MGPAVASAFDEMTGHGGGVRPVYVELSRWLADVPAGVLDHRRREAELVFRRIGITFAVYGDAAAQEPLIPFDVLPRVFSSDEWDVVRAGPGAAREGAQPSTSRTCRAGAKFSPPASCPATSSSRIRSSVPR